MNNVITITLKDGQKNIHRIEFESNPTLSELTAAKLVLEEVLEHNFKKGRDPSQRGDNISQAAGS